MTTTEQRQAILDAVDTAFDEQVAFTSRLIAEPSQRGGESAAQEIMYQAMVDRGLNADRWTLDAESLATHPGAGAVIVDYSQTPAVVGSYSPRTKGGRSPI